MYDTTAHDRDLDRAEARADTAIAREAAERKAWLASNAKWIREDFIEAHAALFAEYQAAQWAEYIGAES
jgi:hypothetical protein